MRFRKASMAPLLIAFVALSALTLTMATARGQTPETAAPTPLPAYQTEPALSAGAWSHPHGPQGQARPQPALDAPPAPVARSPVWQRASLQALKPVLLIMDVYPWGSTSIQDILTLNGIPYHQIQSSSIPTVSLSSYGVVIIPSDQPQSFYDTYHAHHAKFDTYVANGGIVQFHAAAWGFQGGDLSGIPLPGGVEVEQNYQNYNYIELPGHPLVAGLYNPLWGTSISHGHFTRTLTGTLIICTEGSTAGGPPTLIEYGYGDGIVVASGQTLEYGHDNAQVAGVILENMIPYVYSLVGEEYLLLIPSQMGGGPAGSLVSYTMNVINYTGVSDTFDLTVISHTWPISLLQGLTPITNTGPVENFGTFTFTARVQVPVTATPGMSDTAVLWANSVTSPTVYTSTASLNTMALCTPTLVFEGRSEQTYRDLSDVYAGGELFYAYLYAHTADNDSLDVTVSGYDAETDTWHVIIQGANLGSGQVLDRLFSPPVYDQLRVELDDTENDDLIFYDYQIVFCREPTVQLSPPWQQKLVQPGASAVYTQTLTNYMLITDTFALTSSGNLWTTTFWHEGSPIVEVGPLADLETYTFSVRVDAPPQVAPGSLDLATIRATSFTSATISDTATLQTRAVDQLAYVTLADDDLVALVDTASLTVVETLNLADYGCNYPWRAQMSPDQDQVYVACLWSSNLVVIETAGNSVVETVDVNVYAGDVAFVRDGAYALVGGDLWNRIAVIDTATYSVTNIQTPEDAPSLAAHPYLDRAYAACEDGTILVIDTTRWDIVEQIEVGGLPWDVAVSPDGRWVFSGDRWGEGLTVIDAGSNQVHTILTGLGDLTGLAVDPNGHYLYAGGRINGLHVIDLDSLAPVTTIPEAGTVWEIAVTCDGDHIYLGSDGVDVAVVGAGSWELIEQLAMPGHGSQGIAICSQPWLPGLFLYPEAQQRFALPGTAVTYQEILVNATGQADSFDLALSGNVWTTSLSLANTGPVSHGGWISFTAQVTVPQEAGPGDLDVASLQATSVASPSLYSAHASLTTTALCSPSLHFGGQSEQTYGDLDDVYSGGALIYAYVYGHTADDDSLDAAVLGYDPGSGSWQTLTQQIDGGSGPVIDQLFIPPYYTQVRVRLDDTDNDDLIYYDYELVLCREPAVDLSPSFQHGFAQPGQTAVYSLTLTNYMMRTDRFDLEVTGEVWTTTLWHDGAPITQTPPLADLASLTLTARVDVPAGALPGDSDLATVRAASVTSPTIWDEALIQTSVLDDLAYVTLADDDLVALVDTGGQMVVGTVDVGAAGCDFPWRATMSPDRDRVYVGCRLSHNLAVIETTSNTVATMVPGLPYPSDVALIQDGTLALVGAHQGNQIAVVDTSSYGIVATLTVPDDVRGLAAHPYLDRAYAACNDGSLLVIDTQALTLTQAIPFGEELLDVVVSPDGRWVFASDRWGAGLAVIDAGSNLVQATVTGLGGLTGLAVAPDGAYVYAGGRWSAVHVIDGTTFELVTSISGVAGVKQLAVTYDGGLAYLGDDSDAVPFVDLNTFSFVDQIDMPGSGVRDIAIYPPFQSPGLYLYPAAQAGYGPPGQTVPYEYFLVNATGQTDSFDLSALNHAWDTGLSLNNPAPLEDGGWLTFTAWVSVPLGALPGDVDQADVQATSITGLYSDTATLTTTALCSPALVWSGQSAQTEGDLDDVYRGGELIYAYVQAHTADDDSLDAVVSGYDPVSGTWFTIAQQTDGGSGLLVDRYFFPPTYSQARVQLDDTEDDDLIFYDYVLNLCRQPAVVLEPPFQSGSARLGQTAVYTLTATNYTGGTDTFDLNATGNAWPITFWHEFTPIADTGPLADLETFTFTAKVAVPVGAPPGGLDTATVEAVSQSAPTISDTASLQTLAVGDLAYVTLADQDRVALVETGSQSVVGVVDVGVSGCDSPWRATMSPDRDYVYVGCFDSSNIAVIETVSNTVFTTIPGIPNADDIAFVRNGAYALVGNRWSWSHHIAVVDTQLYSVTRYINTPAEAHSVAAHPFLDRAYATSADGDVLVIDTNAFTITASIPVGGTPWDVQVSPDGRWLYTSDRLGAGLTVIDVRSQAVYTTVTGLGDLAGLAAFSSPQGPAVYAASPLSGVHVLDGETFSPVTTLSGVVPAWQIATTCQGDPAYVANTQGRVPVIDTGALTVTANVSMPGSGVRGIAVCPDSLMDVHISKTAGPDPVAPGQPLTYTLLVDNLGNVELDGLTVTDSLPVYTTFAWADAGGALVGDQVRWLSQTVPAGQSLVLRFGVTVTAGLTHGTLINNGDYGLSTPEGLTAFGEPVIVPVENPPLLSISKNDAPDPVAVGGLLGYTLVVENDGQPGGDATGLVVTDTLPNDTLFARASAGGTLVGDQVRWSDQSLPAGTSLTLTFEVTLSQALSDGALIVNQAYGAACAQGVGAAGPVVTTTVQGLPLLNLNKTANPDPVLAGGPLTYSLTVRNVGGADALGVSVSDTLPAGTSFAWADGGGALVGSQVQWPAQAISPGQRLTLSFGVTVGGLPSGTLIVNADYGVRGEGGAGATGDPVSTTVHVSGTVMPALSLAKGAWPDPAQAGGPLTYTLTVHNAGPGDATGVVISDTLPNDTSFAWADQGGSLVGDQVRWENLSVAAGSDRIVRFGVTVGQVPSGTLIANADYRVSSVQGISATGEPLTVGVVVSGPVPPLPALSLTKVDDPDPVEAGGALTYSLTVVNTGQVDATGVVISDTLPDDTTFAWAGQGGALVEGQVVWAGETVPVGAERVVSFGVVVDDDMPAGWLIVNDDYAVRCSQVPEPVFGSVETTVVVAAGSGWSVYLPLVLKAAP